MTARTTIALVAWREIHERLRSRIFLVSTVLMLALVGGSTALNGALTQTQTYRVAATAPIPAELGTALQRAAKPFDVKIRLKSAPSANAGDAMHSSSSARFMAGGFLSRPDRR